MTTKTPPRRSKAEIEAILERAGILPTQQRLDIALVMLERPRHLSADQLLALVNRSSNRVSKATVYNTLALFARKGVVREVVVDPNRIFFDSNIDEHHHLYDEDTGRLTDIPRLQLEQLPELPKGAELVGIDIIIHIRGAHHPAGSSSET